MDPITLIAGFGAIVSTSVGVLSVLGKLVKLIKAEHAFKVKLQATSLTGGTLGLNALRLPSEDLVKAVSKLISNAQIDTEDKKVLMTGLQQPSVAGRQRYAQKLYSEVSHVIG